MKKTIIIAVLSLLSVLVLSGCGNGNESSASGMGGTVGYIVNK